MLPRLLTRLSATGAGLALAVPTAVVRRAVPVARTAAQAASEAAGAGVRTGAHGAAEAIATTRRVGRVAVNAAEAGRGYWRAGARLQLPLRPGPGAAGRARNVEAAARKVAVALARRPDVIAAYWDGGLARLVVQLTEDAVTDRVVGRATELAARERLEAADEESDEETLESAHPDRIGGVRTQAFGLACDAVGLATAVGARTVRLRSAPRLVTAGAGLLCEDPDVRRELRRRLGSTTTDLVLAAAGAAAHGIGRSPTALVLDAVLRTGRLLEAVGAAAAFDHAHDTVCAAGRVSVAPDRTARPPLHPLPTEEYAGQAVVGTLLGAASTALITRDLTETAEALVAGNPKAARYGPDAFTAVLGTELAREGVLVRNPDRLRRLELVDTVVLHPDALRGRARTVLHVNPNAPDWDHDRLWLAAAAALGTAGTGAGPATVGEPETRAAAGPSAPPAAESGTRTGADRARIHLRPVPDQRGSDTGLMIAGADGADVGTVLIGREIDPRAEAALDAARRAGLHVVLADDGTLGDFGALADQLVGAERPLAEVVTELQRDGHVVLTVAHVPAGDGRTPSEAAGEVLAALLRGDLAVAVTDDDSAVVWGADLLALHGLDAVWRLLAAIPAARSVARHSTTLAEAGTALSGLLVVTRGRRARGTFPVAARLSPVNLATAAALLSGWRAALRVSVQGAPHPPPRTAWHALPPREALARLRAVGARPAPAALRTTRDAVRRTARHPAFGPARQAFQLAGAVRAELDDPLTPVLLVGATASALLGSPVDALLVAGAMGMNALVGGVQRLRAENAISALEMAQRQVAHLVRDERAQDERAQDERAQGERTRTVDASRLRPGQLIELNTGEVVPADARLLDVDDLEVDESALTGESLPVTKQVDATPEAPVADRRCMVFEGTTVVAGQARAVVVGTGQDTEAGRAAHLAARTPPPGGVQARLRQLTDRNLPFTLFGGAAVAVLALLRGRPVREAVQGGLAVAVAAVPEGLPLVATVAQLSAARRLSRHGLLVRTPRVLEALGRMDTVCFDKTGTLTENRLRVSRIGTADGRLHPADAPEAEAVLRMAARACPPPDDGPVAHAHSTDEAVLAAAPEPAWTPAQSLPFEASRGYAGATGTDQDGHRLLVVKGAPEVVLPACTDAGADAGATVTALADEGLRVLTVAARDWDGDEEALDLPLGRLRLVGFVALADTPRAGSAALIDGLRRAQVRPVMLTGDHPATARAVAVSLGWPEDVELVTGEDLAALDRAGRARRLRDCGVVARVAPEQKLQVVEALREAGRVVAMVGDGANDAAAIRAADIGVGVAARGSAAARNAADLVVTGDELTVLTDAVAEGRALWRSVADAISILIGGNAGEIGFSVLGTLLSGSAPMSTRQILLVNLLTDMFPAMAVAATPRDTDSPADPAERGGADAPEGADAPDGPDTPGSPDTPDGATGADRPEAPDAPSEGTVPSASEGISALGEPLSRQIRQRGAVTAVGGATAWLIGTATPGSARRTSTMALCGVVGAQLVQTLSDRRSSGLVVVTVLGSAAALVLLVQTPGVSRFFGCTPLGPVAWAGVAAAVGVAAVAPRHVPSVERLLVRTAARGAATLRHRRGG
ncbi:cation-translocating P-type ATPase [Kitasatospora sp. NPDC001539]|uniref:cation-translocating P-type ATPase n=1 Tax=Kitasatospora sp. NPDC001539 TaxID=3154384 RepID=UPI00331AFF43